MAATSDGEGDGVGAEVWPRPHVGAAARERGEEEREWGTRVRPGAMGAAYRQGEPGDGRHGAADSGRWLPRPHEQEDGGARGLPGGSWATWPRGVGRGLLFFFAFVLLTFIFMYLS